MFEQGVQIKELLLAFAKHNIVCASICCDSFLNPVVSCAGFLCVYQFNRHSERSEESKKIVMLNLFQHLTNEQVGQKDESNIINVNFAKSQILKQVQHDNKILMF